MTSADQHEALQRSRSGDASALGALLESYRPYLAVLARSFRKKPARPDVDESDLIQDALLEAHRSLAGFRGETVAEFTGWLRQVAIRTIRRTLRRRAGTIDEDHDLNSLSANDSTPSERAMRHELTMQVTTALAGLPSEMQDVLLARHLHGWSYAEIAQHQGKSEGALRVLYLRALRRLQGELAQPVE